jgi:hypothetical protein
MGQHTRIKNKLTGGMVLGAIAAGALATAGLSSAPTANATCASFFGINSGGNCTSSQTSIAIAIGTNAQAHATGLFGTAFAAGTQANASTADAFTFASAVGDRAYATSQGWFGIAAQLGPDGDTETFGSVPGGLGVNIALDVSLGSTVPDGVLVAAEGVGNLAVNLFGTGTVAFGQQVRPEGILNVAVTLGGTNNKVSTPLGTGIANYAFSVLGSGNHVSAGPGPVAIAGSIGQNGATITKIGPGFNINGFAVGGAAATQPPTAATGRHAATPTAAAGTHSRAGVAASAAAKRNAAR